MSEVMPTFKLMQPETVEETISILARENNSLIFAGGTDILVNMRRGLVETKTLVDISAIADMKRMNSSKHGLVIGAGLTLREVTENELIAKHYPSITQACQTIAGPSHREAATIGGNLCLDTRCLYYNQSDWWRKSNDYCLKYKGETCHVAPNKKQCRAAFSGDLAPALMIHGAQVEIHGPEGQRRVLLEAMYNEDGMDHLKLDHAEIIVALHLPLSRGKSGYRKVRVRGAIDFPLAGVAMSCHRDSSSNHSFTIAVTGTNSCPIMINFPDVLIQGEDRDTYFSKLAKQVQLHVKPLRTTTTAANYRRVSVSALAKKLARELLAG